MLLSAVLKGVGEISPMQDVEIDNVTDKISEVKQNTLFVCIDGDTFDGNSFVSEAINYGAVAVVSEKETEARISVKVPSSRKALSVISSNFYGEPSKKLKMIGVTGTNGKTTTAFLVKHIIETCGKKCGIIGTVYNGNGRELNASSLTTPEAPQLQKELSQMVKNKCEYCVCEVSSQALSQSRTDGISFLASAITNITPEHLNYHLNMQNYIFAKLLLFNSSNSAVVNIDDKNISDNLKNIACKTVSISAKNQKASYFAKNIVSTVNGVQFELVYGENYSVSTSLTGIYNVYNILCAIAICVELGFDINSCVNSLSSFGGVIGRCEKVPVNKDFTVLIDYAHTPDGFQNVISSVRQFTEKRLITVFGCGGDRDKGKRKPMGKIASELSDVIIITDDNPRSENPIRIIGDILEGVKCNSSNFAVVSGRKEAIFFALSIAEKGDTVLLLGKGHEKYQITSKGKIPFDEREIIKEYLNQDGKIWSYH